MSFEYALPSSSCALFWISRWASSSAGWEPGSVEPLRRESWEGTAERDHSTPKATGVKANYCGEVANAASDGAFAQITSSMRIPASRKTIAAVFNEGH